MGIKNLTFFTIIFLFLSFVPISCNSLQLSCNTTNNMLASTEDSFEKIIDTGETLELEIRTQKGNIVIKRGEDKKLRISSKYKVSGRSEESTKTNAEAIKENPPIEVKGEKVIIGNLKKYNLDRWFSEDNVSMDFEIYTPYCASIKVDTGSGNVNVKSIVGSVQINSGLGNIELENITKVNAKTGVGDIKITSIGEGVYAITGKGNIELRNIKGDINAKTGVGNISIDSKIEDNEKWILDSGVGNVSINLNSLNTFNFELITGSGNIEVKGFEAEFTSKTDKKSEGKVGTNPTASIIIRIGKGNILIKKGEFDTQIKI